MPILKNLTQKRISQKKCWIAFYRKYFAVHSTPNISTKSFLETLNFLDSFALKKISYEFYGISLKYLEKIAKLYYKRKLLLCTPFELSGLAIFVSVHTFFYIWTLRALYISPSEKVFFSQKYCLSSKLLLSYDIMSTVDIIFFHLWTSFSISRRFLISTFVHHSFIYED